MTTRHRLLLTLLAVVALALGGLPPTSASAAPDAAAGGAWVSITSGVSTTCGIKVDHSGWCWGLNSLGQVGSGDSRNHPRPTRLPGTWASLTPGNSTTCGIDVAGTGWCWGYNRHGAVGDGTTTTRRVPTALPGTWTALYPGQDSTCGLRPDTTAWCWGANVGGQLGDGTTVPSTVPVQVLGTGWARLSLSDITTCGVRTDGSGWCWGSSFWGQVGDGTSQSRPSPTRLPGDGWVRVDLGSRVACGVRADHSGWCWGANGFGQAGAGTISDTELSPVRVPGDWASIAVDTSGITNCGTRPDGSLWCWGYNHYGALGQGFFDPDQAAVPRLPVQVPGGPWTSVTARNSTVCGVSQGRTWCWGDDTGGAAGVGDIGRDRVSRPHALARSTGTSSASLALWGGGGCFLRSDGVARCWGANGYGQLGDTTTVDRLSPVRVGAAPAA